MVKIRASLLAEVRKRLAADTREQERHRLFANAMGTDPNAPYIPPEFMVRADALRARNFERQERLHRFMAGRRAALTRQYERRQSVKSEIAALPRGVVSEALASEFAVLTEQLHEGIDQHVLQLEEQYDAHRAFSHPRRGEDVIDALWEVMKILEAEIVLQKELGMRFTFVQSRSQA